MSTVTLPTPAAAPPSGRPARRSSSPARTLFRIRFESAISDRDADRARDALDMALYLHRKRPAMQPPLGVAPTSVGGVFLVRGESDREWTLEGRTWGTLSPAAVREAQLEAILAARRLDPSVPYAMRPCRRLRRAPRDRQRGPLTRAPHAIASRPPQHPDDRRSRPLPPRVLASQ